jgi:hypothetical protein
MESRVRQYRQQMTISERRVRKPVQAQGQGAFASLKVFEGDPVRCDPGSLEISHLDLLLSDTPFSG